MQHLWKKRWRLFGSLAMGAVALVLLIAAMNANSSKVCKGINVEIFGPSNHFFVDAKEVKFIINAAEPVEGQPIENINLRVLEDRLKKDKWIETAEVFFDKDHVLQVRVEEKEPVARIFTTSGSSFYIDSTCEHLPLSNSLSARVPMFTNFPSDRQKLSRPDSALMASVKELAVFIQADEFWKAQVAQVDITPNGFEVVPTIGNHIVVLGRADELQDKFDRLFSFYKQVWTKVGLNAYEKIDVQYKGQVVATPKGAAAKVVDSAQARQALDNLLAEAKKRENEQVVIPPSARDSAKRQTIISAGASLVEPNSAAKEETKSAAGKETKVEEKKEGKKQEKQTEAKVPKAVMGKPGNKK
ncbi:cell division protein FtsQ/DivIB [Aridibaculum aurantiacum]|uniref:cell division protein FtsQ/DivIB n=1 Tax=Aridibaculum aurantiacum TaxID=2810307 RepID=UPI001A95C5A8|nr:hypothetical protein [Aridibaculum aurantiacum]